jgi:hypothetical protein
MYAYEDRSAPAWADRQDTGAPELDELLRHVEQFELFEHVGGIDRRHGADVRACDLVGRLGHAVEANRTQTDGPLAPVVPG